MPIEKVVDTIINDVEAYTADEEQDDDITLTGSGQGELISPYSLNKLISVKNPPPLHFRNSTHMTAV